MVLQQFYEKFEGVPRFQIEKVEDRPLLFVVHSFDVTSFQKIMNGRFGAVLGTTMTLSSDHTWRVTTADLGTIHCHLTHSQSDYDMAVFFYKYGKSITGVLKSYSLHLSPKGLWIQKTRKMRQTVSTDPAKICAFLDLPYPIDIPSPTQLATTVNTNLSRHGTRDLRKQVADALMEPIDILHMQWMEKNRGIKADDARIIKPYGIISGMIEHYACAFLQHIEDSQDVITAGEFLECSTESQLVGAFKRYVRSFTK